MNSCVLDNLVSIINETGFKTLEAVNYFIYFSNNQRMSVVELSGNKTPEKLREYQRSLRFFKLMSGGTKNESGLELFHSDFSCIRLTDKGKEFISRIEGVKDAIC